VRRLGSGVLAAWALFPPDLPERVVAEAVRAWDRECHVPKIRQKLEMFVRGHTGAGP
jgi:hypothetical protein